MGKYSDRMGNLAKHAARPKKFPNFWETEEVEEYFRNFPRLASVISVRCAARSLPLIPHYAASRPVLFLAAFRLFAIVNYKLKFNRNVGKKEFLNAVDNLEELTGSLVAPAISSLSNSAWTCFGPVEQRPRMAALCVAESLECASSYKRYIAGKTKTRSTRAVNQLNSAIEYDLMGRAFQNHLSIYNSNLVMNDTYYFLVAWNEAKTYLRKTGSHWGVWIEYFDKYINNDHADNNYLKSFINIGDEVDITWGDGPKTCNEQIRSRIEKHLVGSSLGTHAEPATMSKLQEIASPQALISEDGRIDAGPNTKFDAPALGHDLPTLPIRQRAIIGAILQALPRQAPEALRFCLREYELELKARGVQPVLGLLRDMADIIGTSVAADRTDGEWLEAGLRIAFNRFTENHKLFLEHFTLDPEREAIYLATPVDENKAIGEKLRRPFENVLSATASAHSAGITTPDYLAVMDRMTEFARVLSSQPLNSSPTWEVSPTKRTILTGIGFFERAYNLLGSTVTIAGTPGAVALGVQLRGAIEELSKFLRL